MKKLTAMICLTSNMRGPPSRPTAADARRPAPAPAQYPGEAEVTFPPFTCLEADGEARLERTKEGEVVIFPLKVTWPAPGSEVLDTTRALHGIDQSSLNYRAKGRQCWQRNRACLAAARH